MCGGHGSSVECHSASTASDRRLVPSRLSAIRKITASLARPNCKTNQRSSPCVALVTTCPVAVSREALPIHPIAPDLTVEML